MTAAIYQHLSQLLQNEHPVAVATITNVKGSVPREVGAKMIIHPLGQHVGTVGGGCGEADVIRIGLDVIEDGQPRNVHVDLTEEINMNSLGVCGGTMNVFLERWPRTMQSKDGRIPTAEVDDQLDEITKRYPASMDVEMLLDAAGEPI